MKIHLKNDFEAEVFAIEVKLFFSNFSSLQVKPKMFDTISMRH